MTDLAQPAGTLEFEVTGCDLPELYRHAETLAAKFAAGFPFTIDTVRARPYLLSGDGETRSWQADCHVTVYAPQATQ